MKKVSNNNNISLSNNYPKLLILIFLLSIPSVLVAQQPLFKHLGNSDGMNFGSSIAIIGDVNNDNVLDFAVGAPNFEDSGAAGRGKVTVYSGIDAEPLYSITGSANTHMGRYIKAMGDTNSDSILDFAVTTSGYVDSCGTNPSGVDATISIRSGH